MEFENYKPIIYSNIDINNLSDELKIISKKFINNSLREKRNKLLLDTDRYMLNDYPINDEERNLIKIYRQQLRDFSNNNFELPEKPVLNNIIF
jgi:hypothetical protein